MITFLAIWSLYFNFSCPLEIFQGDIRNSSFKELGGEWQGKQIKKERKGWENLIIVPENKAIVWIESLGIPGFVFKSKREKRLIQFANSGHDPVIQNVLFQHHPSRIEKLVLQEIKYIAIPKLHSAFWDQQIL